jgi:glutamate/tyrosine decarboxylase-like PLP-dependent enzyme
MHPALQNDHLSIHSLLHQTIATAMEYFAKQHDLAPGRYLANLPPSSIPEKGWGASGTLDYFTKHYAKDITNSAGPRYFGFVTGGSTPAAVMGDWLVSAYDQNACGSNDTIAPQLEHQTIDLLKQLVGLSPEYFGSFVTGATLSNFTNLAIARQWIGEQQGKDIGQDGIGTIPINIVSATPHSSILKSLAMLGIGRQSLIKIDTLHDREAVDVTKLEQYLQQVGQPVIVIANAGTVNSGDFDDFEAIGRLKSNYPFWLHIDAAFGGFATLSGKHKHLTLGINYADSITMDAHKWLNVPYDAAMQFTRRKDLQLKVFQNSAAYLGDPAVSPDFFHYTPENSRRWRALPSWFTLMAYGKEGYAEIVERACAAAEQLGHWIASSQHYTLLAPVRLNIVCFTLKHPAVTLEMIKEFLAKVRDDGRVFFTPTVYKGTPAIRAAVSNWLTTKDDIHVATDVLYSIYH